MTIDFAALFQRVLELLTNPRKTWRIIASEPDRGRRLVTRYVLLLALLASLCGLLGMILFDSRYTFGDRLLFGLISAGLKVGIFVGSVYMLGLLVAVMAPSFDMPRSENRSLKLVAYASTPVWVAGFLTLVPQLTPLAALAGFVYAGYLLHLGAQSLLGASSENAWRLALAAIICWFIFTLVTTWIAIQIAGLMFTPTLLLEGLARPPAAPLA